MIISELAIEQKTLIAHGFYGHPIYCGPPPCYRVYEIFLFLLVRSPDATLRKKVTFVKEEFTKCRFKIFFKLRS